MWYNQCMLHSLETILFQIKTMIWGVPLLMLLLGGGIFLTVVLKGLQFRYLGYAVQELFNSKKSAGAGDISPFESLMTSLAGAIGTGTIVGVTTAVTVGGFGAIFWMWVTAFIGMATKYAESLLSVKYRSLDKKGEMNGGPMYYIEKGLGWKWMAVLFAIFGSIAAIGTGNLVQANAISEALNHSIPALDPLWIGIATAVFLGAIILGGVKSIGKVCSMLVPMMALFYFFGGMTVIGLNYEMIPQAFYRIFHDAFSPVAATGGILGGGLLLVIQMGVTRSVFSNEAGLGISSIASAAAQTDSPPKVALITMTGALVSTVIICTITGLVLAVSGVDSEDTPGAALAIQAFNHSIPGFGFVVTVGLVLFAFSTIVAWAYYGEKCFEYLFGEKSVKFYRILYVLIVIPAATLKLEIAWHLADAANGLMVIPNLIAIILLKDVIKSETEMFVKDLKTVHKPTVL